MDDGERVWVIVGGVLAIRKKTRRQCETGGDIEDKGVDRRCGVRERLWRRVENEDELLDLEGYDVEFLWVHTWSCWISVAVAENSMGGEKRCKCRRGQGRVFDDIKDVKIHQCPDDGEEGNRLNGRICRLDSEQLLNKCNIEGVLSEPP